MIRPPVNHRHQRGAALFVAVFVIVAVAAIAAVVALTSSTQHLGAARAILAEQAYYAAFARMESEIPGIINGNGGCTSGSADFFGFETTLSCTSTEVSDRGETFNLFSLTVTASRGDLGTGTFVRRTVRAQVRDESSLPLP